MIACVKTPRPAFSLLEVIIATAILASSAMVLSSFLGRGVNFGNRAETQTWAMNQAQSLLDEFLSQLASSELAEQTTGQIEGTPPRSYRITVTPYPLNAQADEAGSSPNLGTINSQRGSSPQILSLTIELYDGTLTELPGGGRVLCRLSRLVRSPQRPTEVEANALP